MHIYVYFDIHIYACLILHICAYYMHIYAYGFLYEHIHCLHIQHINTFSTHSVFDIFGATGSCIF